MSQDGDEPPTPPAGPSGTRAPLRIIHGGAGAESERPAAPLARSGIAPEGRAKVLRALRLLGGERAFLFVWDDREFTLSEACACDERGEEPRDRNVMWSLLDRITSRREPIVMAGTDEQASDSLLSGITSPLRMAIAVPLLLGDALKGVACFDKRIHRGQFALTDARAAMLLFEQLGLEPGHLELLRDTGVPAPSGRPEPTPLELAVGLRNQLEPCPSLGEGLRVALAPLDAHNVSFWTVQRPPAGSRVVLGRLTLAEAEGDAAARALLCCHRALALFADGSLDDVMHGLAFELSRSGNPSFHLHVSAFEQRAGQLEIAHAGDGVLALVSGEQGVSPLVEAAPPITDESRRVTRARHPWTPGARIVCAQGAGVRAAELLSGIERQASPAELVAHVLARAGAGTSALCQER